jgi:hypothetical protein
MMLVREVMLCKPGKVRALVEKFLAMKKLMEKSGKSLRVMTDVASERYWMLVAEMEVASLSELETMDRDMSPEDAKAFGEIMKGYHDLVDSGRREIYKLES